MFDVLPNLREVSVSGVSAYTPAPTDSVVSYRTSGQHAAAAAANMSMNILLLLGDFLFLQQANMVDGGMMD